MPPGIGAGGFIGIALETTPNTYLAPTKFFPIRNESLKYQQATQWRRPIRQSADNIGGVAGDVHVEGDIEMEAFEEVVPYFHRCSRATVVKSGTTNLSYVFTPASTATPPDKTMSVTVVRNGIVYGYVGLVVSSFKYHIDNGALIFTVSMQGSDEAVQTLPTMSIPSTQIPYGAGSYQIQIPTATQVFDTDTFDFSVDDNADPQYRLKNTGRGAQFMKFGERAVSLTVDRDFIDRTEYDAFKALTAQSVTIIASKGTNNSITILFPAAIKDTYEIGLSGQGDLLRASIPYMGTLDPATSLAYQITVKTQENIT